MDSKINSENIPNSRPRKRVLFIVTQSEIGGAQQFTIQVLKNLNPDDYHLALACGPEGDYEIFKKLDGHPIEKIKIKNLKRQNIFNDLRAVFEIRKIIKNFKPDTLFLNSSKAGFLGSIASKFLIHNFKFKVIYRIGGWAFNDPWPEWKRKLFIFLERLSASWKDIIIVNSAHDFNQAERLGIKPRVKLELVYNGLNPNKIDFFEKDEAKIKLYEHLPIKPGSFLHSDFIFGTIANFYKTKGLEYLVEAVNILEGENKISNAIFVIIGDGPERNNLELTIKRYNLENKILLAGQIQDASRYLKAFDAFILPSAKEGFPWVLLESIAAKIPIIAAKVGAVEEIIISEKSGILVPPKKPVALAEAAIKLMDNPHLRQEMSIQAHQNLLFNFDLEKMIKQTERLIQ